MYCSGLKFKSHVLLSLMLTVREVAKEKWAPSHLLLCENGTKIVLFLVFTLAIQVLSTLFVFSSLKN